MPKNPFAGRSLISRRRFARLPALAGLALAARQAAAAPRNGRTVLVIGAGMAGLAAAIDLKAAGFTVIIIEGRDRVGGRIFTDRSLGGVPLDMGATWIHGISGNPINALRTRYRLKLAPTNYDAMLRYDSDGLPLSPLREVAMERDFASLQKVVVEEQGGRTVDRSLGAVIADFIEARSLSADARRYLGYSVNTEIEHEHAADAADLSLRHFDQDSQFGGQDFLFPNGYGQLTERLKAGLDIETSHTVRSVAHDSSGVRVETQRGTFTGDRVVVTLPLGVLKRGDVGFAPLLPEAKRAAIDSLGMGVLNKCYLRFPRVFWARRPQFLGYVGAAQGQWAEWCNMYHVTRQPILLGFNAGSFGGQLESVSDAEVVSSAMTALQTIYGRSVPSPTGFRVTRWNSDPFSRGAYSYIPLVLVAMITTRWPRVWRDGFFSQAKRRHSAIPARSMVHGSPAVGRPPRLRGCPDRRIIPERQAVPDARNTHGQEPGMTSLASSMMPSTASSLSAGWPATRSRHSRPATWGRCGEGCVTWAS